MCFLLGKDVIPHQPFITQVASEWIETHRTDLVSEIHAFIFHGLSCQAAGRAFCQTPADGHLAGPVLEHIIDFLLCRLGSREGGR